MNDPGGVHAVEGPQGADREPDRLLSGPRAEFPQMRPQIGALDEIHHDGQCAGLVDEVADRDQARAVELDEQVPFPQKPVDDLRIIGELATQRLDGHRGVVLDPDTSPDLAGRTLPEQLVPRTQFAHRALSLLGAARGGRTYGGTAAGDDRPATRNPKSPPDGRPQCAGDLYRLLAGWQ